MKEDNKAYWAGVWFALGIGMVLFSAFVQDATIHPLIKIVVALFMLAATFGAWYTSGVALTVMLLMILEKL